MIRRKPPPPSIRISHFARDAVQSADKWAIICGVKRPGTKEARARELLLTGWKPLDVAFVLQCSLRTVYRGLSQIKTRERYSRESLRLANAEEEIRALKLKIRMMQEAMCAVIKGQSGSIDLAPLTPTTPFDLDIEFR
jgi:hypothetical protein